MAEMLFFTGDVHLEGSKVSHRLKNERARFPWHDPLSKKRWPWTARVFEVDDILEGIGEPFVKVVQTSQDSWATFHEWQRADLSNYRVQVPSDQEARASFDESCQILSNAVMRKLPPEVNDWISDVRGKSILVAKVAAEVDGCLRYLQEQMKIRQALLGSLDHLKVPLLARELHTAIHRDCKRALIQLGSALKKAKKAETHLSLCKERFLNKRSPIRSKDQIKLVNLLIRHGGVRRNQAAKLAAELLKTLDHYFSPRRTSLRVASYD